MGGRLDVHAADDQRPDTLVPWFYTYGRLLMKRGQLCQVCRDYLVESCPMQPLCNLLLTVLLFFAVA